VHYSLLNSETRDIHENDAFFHWPIFGPLLFANESSDARDHCANERSMRPIKALPFKDALAED
jgi:hypothetical protein